MNFVRTEQYDIPALGEKHLVTDDGTAIVRHNKAHFIIVVDLDRRITKIRIIITADQRDRFGVFVDMYCFCDCHRLFSLSKTPIFSVLFE